MKAVLLLDLDEEWGHPLLESKEVQTKPNEKLLQNWFQQAALSYSDRLTRDRMYYQGRLDEDLFYARGFQWSISIFGALATVLVGIKALWQKVSWLNSFVGILALLFSAAVTLLTTVSAYYNSQDEATREQRTVAQLRQLHWRVINDVEAEPYLCSNLSEPTNETETAAEKDVVHQRLAATIESWKNRHETILNDALPSLAKTGDLAKPGDETKNPHLRTEPNSTIEPKP